MPIFCLDVSTSSPFYFSSLRALAVQTALFLLALEVTHQSSTVRGIDVLHQVPVPETEEEGERRPRKTPLTTPLQFSNFPEERRAIPHSRQNSPPAKRIRDWTTSGMRYPSSFFYLETTQVPMQHKTLCLVPEQKLFLTSRPAIATFPGFLAQEPPKPSALLTN